MSKYERDHTTDRLLDYIPCRHMNQVSGLAALLTPSLQQQDAGSQAIWQVESGGTKYQVYSSASQEATHELWQAWRNG